MRHRHCWDRSRLTWQEEKKSEEEPEEWMSTDRGPEPIRAFGFAPIGVTAARGESQLAPYNAGY